MRGIGEITVRVKLPYVHRDVDRYGVERYYFRRARGMPKHRIKGMPGSSEFVKRYEELRGETSAITPPGPRAGTFRWLYTEYLRSAAFKNLSGSTQTYRRNIFERMLIEPVRPDSKDLYEALPVSAITSKSLKVLRDRKAGLPEALNQRVKALRHMFEWALESESMAVNPAAEVRKIAHKSPGHHTWTVEEVERFEEHHPVGTTPRLALALLMWTGARRSDAYLLGKQHARDGWLRFTTRKNKVRVEVPILPCLSHVIEATPTGELTFLTTGHGRPFRSEASFGNWFAKQCRLAKVPGRAHGLRKAGATTAAENGATAHQLMAIFGWLTLAEAERYTKAAERKRMAGEGMGFLVRSGTKDPN